MLKVATAEAVREGVRITMCEDIPANIIKGCNLMSLAGPWSVVRVESKRTVIVRGGEGIPARNELFMGV